MKRELKNKNIIYRHPKGAGDRNFNKNSSKKNSFSSSKTSFDKGPSSVVTKEGTVATASSTISRGKPASVINVSSVNQGETKEATDTKDTIKIVIRDAKPPILARILQFSMRVVCFVLLVAVCGIGIPRLFGVNEFNVLTGSMTPTYPVGTLVFVQPKDPNSIRPGEVVSVIMNEDLDIITHRVVANNYDDKTITTKGDANNSEDSPSLYENIVGVVVFSVPYVGGAVDYLTNDETGRILGIGILLSILALTFLAEAICSFLTKQKANVFSSGEKNPPTVVSQTPVSTKGNKEIKAINKNTGEPVPTKTVKKNKLF